MTFTLAHLSDAHLGPLVGFSPSTWGFKRLTGFYNWSRRRRHVHRRETLAAIVEDLRGQAADHIAVTGDLTNLGLPGELDRAAAWLAELGSPRDVTVIPGNHDIYVAMPRDPGVQRWRAYMRDGAAATAGSPAAFPFVRQMGRIALIGLNSAVPMPPFIAAGRLGEEQLARLRATLLRLGKDGVVRVVLIHHPPLVGQASWSRGLRDAEAMQSVLSEAGAELVLHGHNHQAMQAQWPGPAGPIPVIGVPSASLGLPYKHEHLARYHLYRFNVESERVRIELISRGLQTPDGLVAEVERRQLTVG